MLKLIFSTRTALVSALSTIGIVLATGSPATAQAGTPSVPIQENLPLQGQCRLVINGDVGVFKSVDLSPSDSQIADYQIGTFVEGTVVKLTGMVAEGRAQVYHHYRNKTTVGWIDSSNHLGLSNSIPSSLFAANNCPPD